MVIPTFLLWVACLPIQPDQERAAAAWLLSAVVVDGKTSDQALTQLPAQPLTRELFYGAMRHYFTLAAQVDAALTKPLREKDQSIRCLLIVGAYQLRHSRIPDHAAINETVAACKTMKKTSIMGLVNAVLRRLQRDNESTERSFGPLEVAADFPEWMVGLIRRDYPDRADAILAANLERAPLSLRINQRGTDATQYRAVLDSLGLGHTPAFRKEYVVLDQPIAADALPGFAQGHVAIQDAGAGFVAALLGCQPGSRVLDACAAPGGKLFHLLECQPDVAALAVEKSPERMAHLIAEAQRLGHAPATLVADATTLDWWDGRPFDHVLIDAPCSGSGTLRRHPDIKILRTAADLAGYAKLQGALLTNLWRTVSPGGSLLYCTCSLFAEENDVVLADFLAVTDSAKIARIVLPTGIPRRFGWQLLPTDRNTDGFYFALIEKGAARETLLKKDQTGLRT